MTKFSYSTRWGLVLVALLLLAGLLITLFSPGINSAEKTKAKRRSKHDIYLSWDEWQVWYKGDPVEGNWTEAPHLAEEIYNLEDALVVAQWLNVFLRKSHVLKIACVAQM